MSIATEIQRLQIAKADIKAAIEQKGITVGDGTIDTYAEKIGEISGGGGSSDNVQNPLEYARMAPNFKGVTFPEGYELTLDMPFHSGIYTAAEVGFSEAFYDATNLKKVILKGNNNGLPLNAYCMFYRTPQLEVVDIKDFKFTPLRAEYLFQHSSNLVSIIGEIDMSKVTKDISTFSNTVSLKDIKFVPNTINISISFGSSPNLSANSIQSIIDGLADLTGGTAQTLTFHATVGAKLTDGQKATITAKNWTLVY